MRLMYVALAALALLGGAARIHAEDTGDKVKNGAENVGKTVGHGATGIGKGASKIFHDTASGVHRTIAKNTHNRHRRARHLRKAAKHHRLATRKAHQSEREMNRAGSSADRVGK